MNKLTVDEVIIIIKKNLYFNGYIYPDILEKNDVKRWVNNKSTHEAYQKMINEIKDLSTKKEAEYMANFNIKGD